MTIAENTTTYNVTITSREDGSVEYTHYDCNQETAKYWTNQYGNDPEYDVAVRTVSEKVEAELPYIH